MLNQARLLVSLRRYDLSFPRLKMEGMGKPTKGGGGGRKIWGKLKTGTDDLKALMYKRKKGNTILVIIISTHSFLSLNLCQFYNFGNFNHPKCEEKGIRKEKRGRRKSGITYKL